MLSEWALIEVDGIQMIEISMPREFGGNGRDSQQAMLLIEHEGVVRLGARLSESYIERVVTYNEVAFSTLRALIERAFTQAR